MKFSITPLNFITAVFLLYNKISIAVNLKNKNIISFNFKAEFVLSILNLKV